MKKEKKKNNYHLIFSLVALLIFLIIIFLFFSKNKTCGDGTLYSQCSLNKPYFCEEGILFEKASVCGCSETLVQEINSCVSEYQTSPKNISLNYLLNDKIGNINFIVYGEFHNYTKEISRFSEGKPSIKDMKLKIIENKEQREMLLPLIIKIQNIADEKEEQAKIAVSLVQMINYDNSSNNFSSLYNAINYKYPYQVIYDNIGLCSEKSDLLALLLKELGYGVAIFRFPSENHESVGIKCSSFSDFRDTGYCFVETTGLVGENGEEYFGATRTFGEFEVIEISDGESL